MRENDESITMFWIIVVKEKQINEQWKKEKKTKRGGKRERNEEREKERKGFLLGSSIIKIVYLV